VYLYRLFSGKILIRPKTVLARKTVQATLVVQITFMVNVVSFDEEKQSWSCKTSNGKIIKIKNTARFLKKVGDQRKTADTPEEKAKREESDFFEKADVIHSYTRKNLLYSPPPIMTFSREFR